MRERAIRFGKGTSLIGVLAEPPQSGSKDGLGVVFLNSGILHHVGACRLHVRLARRLADAGFASLRFDLSGIGDSEPRKDSLSFEQSAAPEVQEAMDHLQRTRGVERFALIGLCSGADLGFRVSLLDPRVVGLCQLDAYAYRTPEYYFHYYAPRVTSLTTWRSYLERKLTGTAPVRNGTAQPLTDDYVRPEYRRKFPPREEVAAGLRTLTGRGVALLYFFSGGQPDHYNHRAQYRRSFPDVDFGDLLRVEYIGGADHLFSGLAHQEIVDAVVPEWVLKVAHRQPAPAAAPGRAPAPLAAGSAG